MRLLLDTHALIWWIFDLPKLGVKARTLINDRGNEILFSPASPWEMAIKISTGKLEIDVGDALTVFAERGFVQLDIANSHLIALARLERIHGDPFDRMIVAQAMVEGATIMTEDAAIARYAVGTIGCG